MKYISPNKTSRLKKKLLLYFLLIAIVSISVSAEIILEVSSSKLKNDIISNFYTHIEKDEFKYSISEIKKKLDHESIFEPIYRLRNRMILFLLFVSASIIAAFVLFTKDIVSPMDSIVDATKKLAAGDLTVSVPVITEDEIGLIATLINDMNKNLTDMINQVRNELNKHKFTLIDAHNTINQILSDKHYETVLKEKRMRMSEFKEIIKHGETVFKSLTTIIDDLTELQAFLNLYKTYKIKPDVSQTEIDEAVNGFNIKNN
ncbi:MAG: HAMP domain-containing protein [Spirochaetes bacterium]|nr:HAMP domain-containing protein [Spirochaetota bacterium]